MKSVNRFYRRLSSAFATLTLLLLFGCGGGGGDFGIPLTSPGGIGGTGLKGPVSGATVMAYAITNGAMGAQIGSGTTDANGNFNLSMGSYSGPVMLQLNGGSYTDEATGTKMAMANGDVMTAVLPTVAAGSMVSGVQMTPLTSMAQTMAKDMVGGMTDANITAANKAVGSHFMVNDILYTSPMNPLVSGSGASATQDMRNYGVVLAAMSQYAETVGMVNSSAIVTAMMNDASDGVMDGKMGSSAISMPMGGMMGNNMMSSKAGTSDLAAAMSGFMGSTANMSGLTAADMSTLMQKLMNSDGHMH